MCFAFIEFSYDSQFTVAEMSKVYVKFYGQYTMDGADFGRIRGDDMRRVLFSPDKKHALTISELQDGCLLINNGSDAPFEFSLTRDHKMVANIRVEDGALKINSNWRVTESGVENREIHTNPNLLRSPIINFDYETDGIARLDLKNNRSGFAACVFSRELLFVRMNGDHVVPRLMGFIENEKERLMRNTHANHPAIVAIGK